MLIENWRQFADATVLTKDLDPTYDFLYAAKLDKGKSWAARFALHYLMFYDMGEAAKCAEVTAEDTFWGYVDLGYDMFKRGTERRHSRGALGRKYMYNLSVKGTPSTIMEGMHAYTYGDLVKKMERDFSGCGFGPYFIWKVADFQDRIFARPVRVNLDEALRYMPDEPRKCAKALWPDKSLKDVLLGVTGSIMPWMAPGIPNRPCGFAEAETILCMLKGFFLTRTHTIGDDVDSKYKQLADFPHLHKYLPARQDWSIYERPQALDTEAVSAYLP